MTVRECLTNTSKHAWSNHVRITLAEEPGTLLLSIADDGKGFDLERIRPFANGLHNMRQRMEQVGGRLEVTTAPGKGTITRLVLPV